MNDAWQVSWQEIKLQDEIGGGASGRVWKTQYRNIDVAVKMLIDNDEAQSSLEFAEEIKFMQTMRHRNIVVFNRAGKTSPQARPFLVIDFAHRGSLRHVLDDVSIEIDQNRKIDFALDASKRMEFLQKLNPPRIHRDLKVRIYSFAKVGLSKWLILVLKDSLVVHTKTDDQSETIK